MIPLPAVDYPGQLEAEQEAARAHFDAAIGDALGAEPAVPIEGRLIEGDAAEVLAAESGGAELVVVGSHGRSGLKAALLGSVSRYVVERAECPVVVVKASRSTG
jgi:nucleotide-binding universal stress UspA family protein